MAGITLAAVEAVVPAKYKNSKGKLLGKQWVVVGSIVQVVYFGQPHICS